MGQFLTESKPQRWRAVAIFRDGREGLLFVGQSSAQVQDHYDEVYFDDDLYDEPRRRHIRDIKLQKWVGTPDQGRWDNVKSLPIPEEVILDIGTKPAKPTLVAC